MCVVRLESWQRHMSHTSRLPQARAMAEAQAMLDKGFNNVEDEVPMALIMTYAHGSDLCPWL